MVESMELVIPMIPLDKMASPLAATLATTTELTLTATSLLGAMALLQVAVAETVVKASLIWHYSLTLLTDPADGHFARDCPEPRKMGACFNCGEEGHSKAECTKPRVFKGTCREYFTDFLFSFSSQRSTRTRVVLIRLRYLRKGRPHVI